MMFMMPIPPTTREIPAMTASNIVSIWLVAVKVLISSACVLTVKSLSVPF